MLNWKKTSLIFAMGLLLLSCSHDPQKAKERYLESGRRYASKAQYDAAIVEFRNALQQDPKSIDTLNNLAEAYLANRQPREAYAALMEAVAVDPKHTDVRLNLGRLYLAAGDFKKAEEEASLIVNRDPNNAAAQQVLGTSLAGQNENDKAVEAFEKAAQLSPKDASSYVNLGVSFAAVGNQAEAEANFQKAIALDPRHTPGWLAFASFLARNGQLTRAEQVLQAGLSKNPDDLNLHVALADVYLKQAKAEALDALLNKLRKQLPKPEVALAIGDFFARRNQPQRAISEYQWGTSIAPANLEIKAHLAELYLSAGNVKEADKWNSEVLRARPKDVAAGIIRGRILLAQGKRDEATAELRQQVSEAGDSAQAHYYLGLAYVRNLNSEQAKAEFLEAIRLQPDYLPARLSLGELHLNIGELATAREIAETTVRMNRSIPAAQSLLASVLLQQGDIAGAREHLLIARDLAPEDPAILVVLGASYAVEAKWQDAQHEYEAALKLAPGYALARSQLSAVWIASGHSSKASNYLQQQIAAHPDDAEAHLTLGSLYRQNRDYAKAEAELSRAVELAPDRIQARLQLGGLYEEQGRLGAAIEQCEAALKIDPRSASLHALLGAAHLKKGELEFARKHFEQALAIDPSSAVIANNLAFIEAASGGNLDAALALAQKARELAPDLVNATDTLGWIQYKKGLYPSAVRLLEECVRKVPDSATYKYHYGMALIANGDRDRGRSTLDAALHLNLTGEEANRAREALARIR